MSTKSNLELANKYEWLSMHAKNRGDTQEANMYESLAKMSVINAGLDHINSNTNYAPLKPKYTSTETSFKEDIDFIKENKKTCILIWSISIAVFVGIYIISPFL